MKPPAVYKAIAAVTAELSRAGIAKNQTNEQEGWAFRGIDDVYNALSPLLARHKLCILPRILRRDVQLRRQSNGDSVSHVALKVVFDFVSAQDGSRHEVEIWGEGADRADKATNKALASAYKYAAFQVFCIPIAGQVVDGDAETVVLGSASNRSPVLEPVQGWTQWVSDIVDMVGGCQTDEALARIQTTYRGELHLLSSHDAAGYKQVGEAVAALKRKLREPAKSSAMEATDQPERGEPAGTEAGPQASKRRRIRRTAPATTEKETVRVAVPA